MQVHQEALIGKVPPRPPAIREALDEAAGRLAEAGVPSPRLDARLLAGQVLGMDREALLAREHERISWEGHTSLSALVDRRIAGEPVAYIRGVKEFWSLELEVGPDVLIPRPDTEILVEACLEDPALEGKRSLAVDVGTGSGAVAIALASSRPRLRVLATDVSRRALAVARRNCVRHGVLDRVALVAGDLLSVLRGGADCIAANLPYIPTDEIPDLDPGIRDNEPREAIDGGPDGLALVRRLVAEAADGLRPGGLLALEIADTQAGRTASMLSDRDWTLVAVREDLGRLKRVVTARRRP
ncbi:MAG: peptide chain release factor N(5)-glutamine methyltransferase [Deltaproteobacteria bacterium]|nr:peptide chain release factor N(5)-glutamine methyltransferase [Deltaproteobacteria bacterium]